MSKTISIANEVIHKLDTCKPVVARNTGKDEPSYSGIILFLIARAGIKYLSHRV